MSNGHSAFAPASVPNAPSCTRYAPADPADPAFAVAPPAGAPVPLPVALCMALPAPAGADTAPGIFRVIGADVFAGAVPAGTGAAPGALEAVLAVPPCAGADPD